MQRSDRSKKRELYKEAFRIKSSRLPYWDYGSPGMYFVTICTNNMKPWFGYVIEDIMHLNALGQIVKKEWKRSEAIRKNVELDEWIIMPNHFHGILWIKGATTIGRDVARNVSTSEFMSNISPKRGSLSTIIRSFKSAVTKHIRKNHNPNFAWQSQFYDHVIRNETALENIRNYIKENPKNWERDRNNQNLDPGISYQIKTSKRIQQ